MTQKLESTFKQALGRINSELWVSLAGLSQIETVARWMEPLDGTNHQNALQSAFPFVKLRLLKRVRLKDHQLSTDLRDVCRTASRWMFTYFTVLVRSLAENNVRNRVAELEAIHPTFRAALRTRARQRKKRKSEIINAVAQEICRGQHGWFKKQFTAYDGTSGGLDRHLYASNRVRNTIAHRLLEKRGSRAISEKRWIAMTTHLQALMRRLP